MCQEICYFAKKEKVDPCCMFLAINIMDRSMMKHQEKEDNRGYCLLIAIASLWIAMKVEEIYAESCSVVTKWAKSENQKTMRAAETQILKDIEFDTYHPTFFQYAQVIYLIMLSEYTISHDSKLWDAFLDLGELYTCHFCLITKYTSLQIACACLVSTFTLTYWTPIMEYYCHQSWDVIQACRQTYINMLKT